MVSEMTQRWQTLFGLTKEADPKMLPLQGLVKEFSPGRTTWCAGPSTEGRRPQGPVCLQFANCKPSHEVQGNRFPATLNVGLGLLPTLKLTRDFQGPWVKSSPSNAGDASWMIPGWGTEIPCMVG